MKDLIVKKLQEIEQKENVRILLAIESGSRAWGFASPDSDYDVRFVYVRQKEEYICLDQRRDVIELPIDDMLDINGWDVKKAFRLLYKSNPTFFEWAASPILYIRTEFLDDLKNVLSKYFSVEKSLYHYLNMANKNYELYLKSDTVKAKKYFYVLRPVLACWWILHRGTPPPVLFSELVEAELPKEQKGEVNRLLALKMNSPEVKQIPAIASLNAYLATSIETIQSEVKEIKKSSYVGWDELNELFRTVLDKYAPKSEFAMR